MSDHRLDPATLREGLAQIDWVVAKTMRSLGLVTRLYLAGGFPLLSRAWERPPTLYRHLSGPESYVAGVRRTPLPRLRELPGYVRKEEGYMDGPAVRALINQVSAAPGGSFAGLLLRDAQRGFWLTILDRTGWGEALVASSAWDTPADAGRFVAAWTADRRGGEQRGNFARQRGPIVVVTAGVSKAEAEALFDEILPQIAEPLPPLPPLGELTLPPLPAPPSR